MSNDNPYTNAQGYPQGYPQVLAGASPARTKRNKHNKRNKRNQRGTPDGGVVSIVYGGGKRVRHPCLPAPSSAVSPFVRRRKAGVWGAPPYAFTSCPCVSVIL